MLMTVITMKRVALLNCGMQSPCVMFMANTTETGKLIGKFGYSVERRRRKVRKNLSKIEYENYLMSDALFYFITSTQN